MTKLLAKVSAAFAWVVGTEFSHLKLSDFIHVFFMDRKHLTEHDPGYPACDYTKYRSIKSWVWGVSFLRGKGYCHWMFGRRFSLPGFTMEIGWRCFRYLPNMLMERRVLAVSLLKNGNHGWMPR